MPLRLRQHGRITAALALAGAVVTASLLASCTIGPTTVPRDRLGYADALARSAREELLMNIVRIRYMESPIFLTINSVVNQYALETQVNAGAAWSWGSDLVPGSSNSVGAAGRFSDRPTITYAPMIGRQFTESYLTPIRPESLLAMIESGWRVDGLFPLMVHSINGVRNRFYAGRTRQELDLRFARIVECMAQMQDAGTLSIRVEESPDTTKPSFMFILSGTNDPEDTDRVTELKEQLGLRPDADRYRIVFGARARDDTEIAIVTRSVIAILGDMSSYIQVPEQDMVDGRAIAGAPPEGDGLQHPITVDWSEDEPDDAYVRVRHRDVWFYIDDRDIPSKRTFLMLILLSTLAESSEAAQTPLLTIPTTG